LYDYIRWHSSGKRVHATTATVLLARYNNTKIAKPSRKRTVIEIYSDLYYKTKFAEQVRKETEETTPDYPESKQEFSARKMNIYRKWREISWAGEDDQVKAHVHRVHAAEHLTNDEGMDDSEDSSDETEWREIQRRQR
jgi:hypothetical protein